MNDTTWFWQIVDARGLADVSSDEFVALNELISKAERAEEADARSDTLQACLDHRQMRLDSAEARSESLSRDLAEARAAVEPFAAFAGYWDGLQTPDDRKFISVGDACKLTVGDLRRARSVLPTQPKETPDVA